MLFRSDLVALSNKLAKEASDMENDIEDGVDAENRKVKEKEKRPKDRNKHSGIFY